MVDRSEIRYAKSGEISVAYEVIGDGPRDLIFVPGIISHVEFFHELPGYTEFLEGLASFARVIVFDKRGNGLSDRVVGASSLEERMDDIRAVMDAVGSERATLFGVSEGGPISLLFAATYPARVDAIVLYETFVCYGGVPGHTDVWEPDEHREFTEFLVERYGTGESLLGFGTSRIEEPRVVSLWAQAERLSNSPGGLRAMYSALLETDVHAALPSVQAPCLVMHGTTMSMFEQQSKYLAEHLPDARLATLDGVDHFPWFADVDRVVSEVEEFVTGARSAVADERVLATLLFTDIVGSTEKAAAMGDRRWHEVIESYYRLVRRCVERFRGVEVSTEGDGFIARFDGPARAVSCAARHPRRRTRPRDRDPRRCAHRRDRAPRRRHRRPRGPHRRPGRRARRLRRGARLPHRQRPRRRFGNRVHRSRDPPVEGRARRMAALRRDLSRAARRPAA